MRIDEALRSSPEDVRAYLIDEYSTACRWLAFWKHAGYAAEIRACEAQCDRLERLLGYRA